MKNLKNILLLFLILFSVNGVAQEGLILKPLNQDTTQLQLERQIEYRQLISGNAGNELFMDKIELPAFDFKNEFGKRYSQNFDIYSFNGFPNYGFSTGMLNPYYSPFYQNGMVLSEGAYKFSDKFTFGGFSYGSNSMLSGPPMPTPGMDKFDRYGSTLFMQYKVSKNFKIETRFNISQGGRYSGF